ncbi:MAG: alpha/beta fold hydrolase [Pseudomonadales bacterium]|nr:alpha/beta fold hydrolase [Pseudomonadales bacterium]
MSSTEQTFNVLGANFAAKHWHNSVGYPTFALHGWLDNANTFDLLAPSLAELDILALDFAGHGRSDHRPQGVHYHSLFDIQDILAIADQLGWTTFRLIGHSMGAAVASELAALFPDRVESAVLIDGFLATGGVSAEDRLEQNREAVTRMLRPAKVPRAFANVEAMADRVTQATDQSLDAARALVARGHKEIDQGVTWRTDPRIRAPTPLRYTLEQVDQLIAQTTSSGLLLAARNGDKWYQGEIERRQKSHPNLTVHYLDGPHHLHLEPAYADSVIKEIRDFWQLDQDIAAAS